MKVVSQNDNGNLFTSDSRTTSSGFAVRLFDKRSARLSCHPKIVADKRDNKQLPDAEIKFKINHCRDNRSIELQKKKISSLNKSIKFRSLTCKYAI